MKDHIALRKAVIEKVDPDILITRYKPNTEILESDAQEIDNAHVTMSQGLEMFIIADLSEDSTQIEKQAQDFFVHKGKMIPYTRGIAIVSTKKSSFFSRVFGANSKTLYPTKEFDTIDQANQWIESLRASL